MKSGLEKTKSRLNILEQSYTIFLIDGIPGVRPHFWKRLPYSIRGLLEGVLHNMDHDSITLEAVQHLANWKPEDTDRQIIPFFPTRVILQDFTGVPVMNDLAAMRSALAAQGVNPKKVNPVIPVDLVIDHSVIVDDYGHRDAAARNEALEFERNQERFQFLRWCERAFDNFRVIPPASGIIHQINLEYLTQCLATRRVQQETQLFAETLVGTDSHTTMINGLGVTGWGVGGIEAVSAMMGQPTEIVVPDVIGVYLEGCLPEGSTATDLTLTIIQMLRKFGVVDKFVEVFGPGAASLSLSDRTMIANMAPECGATMIYFPIDEQTLEYLRLTGKSEGHIQLVERYFKKQHLFRQKGSPDPLYTQKLVLDLGEIEPSLSGPKYPQNRMALSAVQGNFRSNLTQKQSEQGFGLAKEVIDRRVVLSMNNETYQLTHGFIAIAAITSCTNTSNPAVMVAAGLLAKKAVELGLRVPGYVKTSLAPGSRVVREYLAQMGLLVSLEKLGFHIVGYGCTTCIGNSGPLRRTSV